MKKLLLLIITIALSACSSAPPLNKNNDGGNSSVSISPSTKVNTVDVSKEQTNKFEPGLISKTIYFDTDSYVIKPQFETVVVNHSSYIKDFTGKLILQGHTDQRGTSEYNIALGQKRAEALKKALVLLGSPENKIETVSFGKEKPAVDANDDAAYSKNRRAEFVYN